MSTVFYEVEATFKDESIARQWVDWMLKQHLADVVKAGALRGRLIRLDEGGMVFAAHYEFADRPSFQRYLREEAPRLRAAGEQRFGPGFVTYRRRDGDVIG